MEWWQWLIGILLFVISLSFLVAIHELGHFATAKMFRVFCFDYSIGFGPKLVQFKRKTGETTFTIRAIPLGGFVSMFGEGAELEGKYITPNRNLEGISRMKRALVFAAGIILNFFLGFVLIFVSNQCFNHAYTDSPTKNSISKFEQSINISVANDSYIASLGVNSEDALHYYVDPVSGALILDKDVVITNNEVDTHYVLCIPNTLSTTKYDPVITDDMHLFVGVPANDAQKECGLEYAPDVTNEYLPVEGYSFKATLSFYQKSLNYDVNNPLNVQVEFNSENNKWANVGLGIKLYYEWYDFPTAISKTWNDFIGANTAIAKAIGGLFIGTSWNQIGGPVAILTQTTSVFSSFGFGQYIYYWGFISCNLALFNLLPFPGLDGWSLLVLAVEGISKKKMPTKVKNIISFVGLIILFAFMGLVLLKDVIGLF